MFIIPQSLGQIPDHHLKPDIVLDILIGYRVQLKDFIKFLHLFHRFFVRFLALVLEQFKLGLLLQEILDHGFCVFIGG